MIPLAVAYIPEYSYDYSYAHVLFVWEMERHRPRLKKTKPVTFHIEAADPLSVIGQLPWSIYIEPEK